MQTVSHRLVWVVWLCLLLRGAFYSILLPIWEGYDEWAHVAYVQLLASGQGLPVLGKTVVSREVAASLELTPLPHGHPSMSGTRLTHDDFWRLTEKEREARRRRIASIPREWAYEPAPETILNHEAQQPPLYYLMLAPIQLAAGQASLPVRILLMRLASLLVTSLTIPLAYIAARRVLGSPMRAAAAAAVIASMPGFLMSASRTGNDGISAVVFTALTCVLLVGGRPWLAGILLGAGLLIKATFLTAIPAVGLIFAWRYYSAAGARRQIALDAVVAFFTAGALSGWWYWRNHALTGSWSALQQVVARGEISPWSLLGHIPGVDWWRFLDIAVVSHIWSGNWSFLQLRSWMYRVLACIALAAAAGLVRKIWHGKDGKSHALVLGSIYAFFWLGLCYHELTFSVLGLSSSAGWYAYAMGAALFTMLDLYATHFVLLPYYTGMVAHRAGGALVSFQVGRFAELPVMLGRLAVPLPAAILLWLCFLVATVALPVLTFRGAAGAREDGSSGR